MLLSYFVKAAAMFLDIPIPTVMERSIRTWPYSIYWPQDAGEVHSSMTMEGYTGNFIIIGNSETDDHFQSLRFVGKLPWDNYETSSQDIDFQVERCVVTSDVVWSSNSNRRKGEELDCPILSKQSKYDSDTEISASVLAIVNSLVDSVANCSKECGNESAYKAVIPDPEVVSLIKSLKYNVYRKIQRENESIAVSFWILSL